MLKINTIVLHRITADNLSSEFEDVNLKNFELFLDYISKNIINKKMNILLTFDDGNDSDYKVVLPLLIKYKIKAIFFIVANRINKPGYLTKFQINSLVNAGMEIGSHSFSHQNMTKLSQYDVIFEFKKSKKIIEDCISREINAFSFPYGKFNKELVLYAQQCGYSKIFTSKHGVKNDNGKIFPRNSLNSKMNFNQGIKNIFPSKSLEIKWKVEDLSKTFIKNIFGENLYKKIRNFIL
jgi:peptidoglycan/xylan/chitin deacetylase (PgdA/CDA1 family)